MQHAFPVRCVHWTNCYLLASRVSLSRGLILLPASSGVKQEFSVYSRGKCVARRVCRCTVVVRWKTFFRPMKCLSGYCGLRSGFESELGLAGASCDLRLCDLHEERSGEREGARRARQQVLHYT